MSEIPDLCKADMAAISEAIELWEKLHYVLGRANLVPDSHHINISRRDYDGEPYLGWIGCNPDGDWVFQPATERPVNE